MGDNRYYRTATNRDLSRKLDALDTSKSDRATGTHIAEVTNVDDPKKLGRIKVRLEYQRQDEETDWISPRGGFQGNGYGSTFNFPVVGDKVRLDFLGGNIHNMMWSDPFFHDEEKADLTEAKKHSAPLGRNDEDTYDATKDNRVNILRSISGWVLQIFEGFKDVDKWHLYIKSPTMKDVIEWFAPNSPSTNRRFGVWRAKIDDMLEFSDNRGNAGGFIWDGLNKLIQLKLHRGGKYEVQDNKGGIVEWKDEDGSISINLKGSHTVTTIGKTVETSTRSIEKTAPNVSLTGTDTVTITGGRVSLNGNVLNIQGLAISISGTTVDINGIVKINGIIQVGS